MKVKIIAQIFLIAAAFITVLNFTSVFSIDSSFNLKFANVEAMAMDEEWGGYELRIGMCEDGVEDFTSCEWDPELTGRNCEMSDERDCSPGNNPSNPGQMGNNESCVQNGHMFYESSCFRYCLRCNYTKYICD